MEKQKDIKITIDEHLLKEAGGTYSVETAPGVYYNYDSNDVLISTVRLRGDHYIIKHRGYRRDAIYADRVEKELALIKEEAIFAALEPKAKPIEETIKPPKWA